MPGSDDQTSLLGPSQRRLRLFNVPSLREEQAELKGGPSIAAVVIAAIDRLDRVHTGTLSEDWRTGDGRVDRSQIDGPFWIATPYSIGDSNWWACSTVTSGGPLHASSPASGAGGRGPLVTRCQACDVELGDLHLLQRRGGLPPGLVGHDPDADASLDAALGALPATPRRG